MPSINRSSGTQWLIDWRWQTASVEDQPAVSDVGMVRRDFLDHSVPRVIVIVGWSSDSADLLYNLDMQLKAGSEVHVLAETPVEERKGMDVTDNAPSFKNFSVHHIVGPTSSVRKLRDLPMSEASAILIVAGDAAEFDNDASMSDSANLAVVVTLNALLNQFESTNAGPGWKRPSVICQIKS